MLPGFTGYSAERDHVSINYNSPNTGASITKNQGIILAGGSGGSGRCPAGCWEEVKACYGVVQFCHCRCWDGSAQGGDWACGACIGIGGSW
jgi:hypothetical protein